MARTLPVRFLATLALAATCTWPSAAAAQSKRYVWAGYARTPQHDALADVAAQPLAADPLADAGRPACRSTSARPS